MLYRLVQAINLTHLIVITALLYACVPKIETNLPVQTLTTSQAPIPEDKDYLSRNKKDTDYMNILSNLSDVNSDISGFTTSDYNPLSSVADNTTSLEQRKVCCNIQKYIQTAVGTFLYLINGFIGSASSQFNRLKTLGLVCNTNQQLIRNNRKGYILKISIINKKTCNSDFYASVQQKTIASVIEKWIQRHSHICGTWCMNLSQSGDWEGYISVGIGQNSIDSEICESVHKWGSECLLVSRHGNSD